MRALFSSLLAAAIVGAGCSKPVRPQAAEDSAPRASVSAAKPSAKSAAPVPVGPTLPQLAYSYQAEVQAGAGAVPQLLARHEGACLRAGAAVCQVIGAERAAERDGAHAELKLRAQPA